MDKGNCFVCFGDMYENVCKGSVMVETVNRFTRFRDEKRGMKSNGYLYICSRSNEWLKYFLRDLNEDSRSIFSEIQSSLRNIYTRERKQDSRIFERIEGSIHNSYDVNVAFFRNEKKE